jgi:hypothetical protein
MRIFKIILLIIIFLTPSLMAIDLPVECRVHNKGSYCVWASLDTLARFNRVDNLIGCHQDRINEDNKLGMYRYTYHTNIEIELKKRNVKYLIEQQQSRKTHLLEKYAATHGVAACLSQGNPHSEGGCHMIVITEFGNK